VISAQDRAQLAALAPSPLPSPPADASNRFADNGQAALFGQALFFDTGFSGALLEGDNDGTKATLGVKGQTGRVSCAGCHVAAAGFLDNRSPGSAGISQVSLAAGWSKRRTPSLLDVGQSGLLHWDGRHDALWNQPFGPLEHANEMNSSRLYAAEQIFARYRVAYEAIFGAMPALDDANRFPQLAAAQTGCNSLSPPATCHGYPGDGAEYDGLSAADQQAVTAVWVNAGKALEAYERKLACGPGRFDAWVNGDASALTPAEQRGAALFVGGGNCISCHSGPYLSDEKFHNTGLVPKTVAAVILDSSDTGAVQGLADDLADPLNTLGVFSDGNPGRLPSAVAPSLSGAFRTPKLRCVSRRPSLMHTGQLSSLLDVASFFNRGGDLVGASTNELKPLGLSAADLLDLQAFLMALEGPGPDASLLAAP
jgi:cytochrome c peroxidase